MNIHQVTSRVKNGKKVFYFRWDDPETGKRRERSAKTKKEAEAMRRDLVAKWLGGNLPTEKSKQTVARVVEAYLDAREDDVRANNITRGQFDNIRVYMKPWAAWADRSIGQIDPVWVKAALDGLAVRGATKRKYLVGWGGFAKWMALHGYRNDLITMHCRVSKVAKPEMWFPPDETVKALLATSDGKWRAIIATLAMCGLRCGEIRALPWENVSINGGYIKVRQAVERCGRIAGPKTEAGNREVPLPAFVGSMYADLPRRGDLVFPRDDGTPMTNEELWRGIKPVIDQSGVEWRHQLHVLRHFAASRMIDLGWSIKRVQVALGHASYATTADRYGHLVQRKSYAEEAEEMARGFG